ncbi:hypothetical protein NDR87_19345 [Nocardia sp. CDC159]|uniref:Uncharacterized protein n=1 Tax=Nocardia pulmonis TaxID=2951408 RepID=A0A9X2IXL7_9NOCA|nr:MULTISPECIES: hypothetical protein [Nocardia]MCM6776152.1 hypothetical protein [Nocardia pulmonis]MCM6788521.1 hypothetical protein [Nocardia sp. CDC159]
MRRATALKGRPAEEASAPIDPNVDPPIVATLVRPLLHLRASLGTGRAAPNDTIAAALSNSSARAADTEAPHRQGVHALESTWTGTGADAAVPALRTTQTQIGDISDRGPAYLSVLSEAHATSSRAARQVDRIIADFRSDARAILGNATAAPDTDAVIARATQALREAISTVQTARSEMDGHTQRLSDMGPLTVTRPTGLSDDDWSSTPTDYSDYSGDTYSSDAPLSGVAPTDRPMDPAQAAQLQLQRQLIQAGVQVGTAAINAGVDIGTHLIDKIAEVGMHAMDTVAASVDKVVETAVPELIRPGSTSTGDGTAGSKIFDFGGGTTTQPSGPSTPSAPGVVIPPAPNSIIPPAPNAAPGPPGGPKPTLPESAPAAPPPVAANPPAPAPNPAPPAPVGPPKPPEPGQPGVTGGLAMPPAQPPNTDQEHKPRDGQLGVTVPAMAVEDTVPAAVIGDFGDDTI